MVTDDTMCDHLFLPSLGVISPSTECHQVNVTRLLTCFYGIRAFQMLRVTCIREIRLRRDLGSKARKIPAGHVTSHPLD